MEDLKNKKILIVDDDDDLRTILVDKFKDSGFEPSTAPDGELGLKVALETHPDLILLDVMMPVMDGWSMLKKLREDDWGKDAKVIMLTVSEDSENVAKAVEKQSIGYLIKTKQSLDEIITKVKEMIAMH